MKFTYTARDKNGQESTGTIIAANKLEAADQLFNKKQLNVVNLEQVDRKKEKSSNEKGDSNLNTHQPKKDLITNINDHLAIYTKVKPKDKAVMFRLLAVMINAGLSIVKALKILANQSENAKLRIVLRDVSVKVETGTRFSDALSEHSEVFIESEIGMIAAGEASGQLNKTLVSLATETEKSASLRKKIKSAMIYPIVVLIVMLLATILIMTMVIPKLAELFASAGTELPLSTRILVNTSNWFIAKTFILPNWLLFIAFVIGGIFGFELFSLLPFFVFGVIATIVVYASRTIVGEFSMHWINNLLAWFL
jgi:type II secretory pathway component PulF